MAETQINVKPFWGQDSSLVEQDGLKSIPKGDVSASQIAQAVPKLQETRHGDILICHGIKDDLLVFQIYKISRKAIFDQAMQDLEAVGRSPKATAISIAANEALVRVPWPEKAERYITAVFDHHCPGVKKIDFFREVDSWSVLTPNKSWDGDPSLVAKDLSELFDG